MQKGKAQYNWPPCTNKLRSAVVYIENINGLFTKSYLYEEVNGTEPFPSASVPWSEPTKVIILGRWIKLFLLSRTIL